MNRGSSREGNVLTRVCTICRRRKEIVLTRVCTICRCSKEIVLMRVNFSLC